MTGENTQNGQIEARRLEETGISEEMEDSYISYAMSVIAGRALPDVRDGLKPVQRRIIYSMYSEGIKHSKSHRKSSNIVGHVMGNYHPHGDKSIYDALVRMAQDFSLNKNLIDGQGNFGSIDGDPPAAMRYTEARMSEITSEMIKDIDKNTVDFQSNYDDRGEEPKVLPSAIPNLLVNGTSGIAVGMSTSIPPHNLKEVCEGIKYYIDNPNCEISDLTEFIKGPDFPTGGEIIGKQDYMKAYSEGKGSVTVRSKYDKNEEDNQIIVKEIPYKVEKSKLIKNIASLVKNDDIESITNVRDHSDRNRMKIVIDIKNSANIDIVEKKLIEKVLEKKITILNLALQEGSPKVHTLKDFIKEYVEHRVQVIQRKSEYELKENKDELHLVKGKLKAVKNSEDIIETIRNSENKEKASQLLQNKYNFTEKQAESILRLQLSSLTSMNIEELKNKKNDLETTIQNLETLLNDKNNILEKIKQQLDEIKDKYGEERRTIITSDYQSLTEEDLIPEKENFIILTEKDYIKRTDTKEYKLQHRNGKGVKASGLKNGDKIKQILHGHSHSTYIIFTEKGQFYNIKGYDIPEKSRTSQPEHLTRILPSENEKITSIVEVNNKRDNDYLVTLTENGIVKKTELTKYLTKYAENSSIKGVQIENDKLVDVVKVKENEDLLIATQEGKAIRFNEEQLNTTARNSKGVIGIKQGTAQSITTIQNEDNKLITISSEGRIQKTSASNYTLQNRGGKGMYNMKTDKKIIKTKAQQDKNCISITDGKNLIIFPTDEVRTVSRNSKGVQAMDTNKTIKDFEIN